MLLYNRIKLLESLNFLTNDDISYNINSIPVLENKRLDCFIVRLEDVVRNNDSIQETLNEISLNHNIPKDKLCLSIKEQDCILPSINESFDYKVIIRPFYSKSFYNFKKKIDESIRLNSDDIFNEEQENPLPYYNTLRTSMKTKSILKDKGRQFLKSKKFKVGVAAGIGAYGYKKFKDKHGQNPIQYLKDKIATLRLAYRVYNGEYEKAVQNGYKNYTLLKKILIKLREKIKYLVGYLKSLVNGGNKHVNIE